MVISRNGILLQPCIKESSGVASNQYPKPMTKRVSELPSLRYGPIGSKTTISGPLKVASKYNSDTFPRKLQRKSRLTSGSNDDLAESPAKKPLRPPRRVRFSLPPADDDTDDVQRRDASNAKTTTTTTTTAGESWRSAHFDFDFGVVSQRPGARLKECRGSPPSLTRRSAISRKASPSSAFICVQEGISVPVTVSPGVRNRVHPTGRYIKGTLSPTSNATPHATAAPGGQTLLRAARDGDDSLLRDRLRRALLVGEPEADLNAVDSSGRTVLSYVASNGTADILETILQLPGLDPNKPDNEGNTPLHFAAQAGQIECLNCLISRCRGIEIDARNDLGFTPLMKAALQGRNKCAKLLLFAGANPTLRDNGRGFRADQWARFCGRYVCADVIEKYARQRLLERSTSYGSWGCERDIGTTVVMGKVLPMPPMPEQSSKGLKSKLRRVFRTSSSPTPNDAYSSARLVTQLTSAALCASSPVLPNSGSVPPVVKSLIRPLTVPKLQITLVNNNADVANHNLTSNGVGCKGVVGGDKGDGEKVAAVVKPARTKKKK